MDQSERMRRALALIADMPPEGEPQSIRAAMMQQIAAIGLGRQTVSKEALDLVLREFEGFGNG